MAHLYSLSFLYICCLKHMVAVKNKTLHTYGNCDRIVIIVAAIYHLLYEYLECSVKLTEE
jgi:hypothetical protein